MSWLLEKYRKIPVQAKLTVWTFVCMCIQRGISVLTVPLFTRLMSTEQYGQYSVYTSWLNIVSIFTSLRLYAGVYNKGLTKYKDDMDGFALSMQYTTTILTGICTVIYLIFRKQFNALTDMSTPITLLMFAELCMTTPLQFWSVKQRYNFKYKSVVLATVVLTLLNPALGFIGVCLNEEKGIARIVSAALAQICVGCVFYAVNLKSGKFRFNREYSKFAIKFNLPLIPHYFSEYILNQSDRVMIQKLCGYSEAALYSVAYNAGMILTIVSSSINQALVPWLYQSLDKRDYEAIRKNTNAIGIMVGVILCAFILFAPEAVLILGGSRYAEAKYVIPPVTISIYFLFWYTLFANVEFYCDKNKYTMYISMFGAVLNIGLNYIFMQIFGYVAAAYTSLFCYMVYSIGHFVLMERVFYAKNKIHLFSAGHYFAETAVLLAFMSVTILLYEYFIIRLAFVIAIVIAAVWKRRVIAEYVGLLQKKKKTD